LARLPFFSYDNQCTFYFSINKKPYGKLAIANIMVSIRWRIGVLLPEKLFAIIENETIFPDGVLA
jgi:hypothetical protein